MKCYEIPKVNELNEIKINFISTTNMTKDEIIKPLVFGPSQNIKAIVKIS